MTGDWSDNLPGRCSKSNEAILTPREYLPVIQSRPELLSNVFSERLRLLYSVPSHLAGHLLARVIRKLANALNLIERRAKLYRQMPWFDQILSKCGNADTFQMRQ